MKRIPTWGWVAIAGVLVGGYLLYRRSRKGASSTAGSAAPLVTSLYGSPAGYYDNSPVGSVASVPTSVTTTPSSAAPIVKNVFNANGTTTETVTFADGQTATRTGIDSSHNGFGQWLKKTYAAHGVQWSGDRGNAYTGATT